MQLVLLQELRRLANHHQLGLELTDAFAGRTQLSGLAGAHTVTFTAIKLILAHSGVKTGGADAGLVGGLLDLLA